MAYVEPIDELAERQCKEPEDVLRERLHIIMQTINQKSPARIPIGGLRGDVILTYSNVSWYDVSYELTDRTKRAVIDFYRRFPGDFYLMRVPYGLEGFVFSVAFADFPEYSNVIRFLWGPVHDVLRDKWSKWPGRELRYDQHPQFIGAELMKAEEYRELIDNPVGFIHNAILPRACPGLGTPGTFKWNGALLKIGVVLQKIMSFSREVANEFSKIGVPSISTANSYCPADFIADFLRHIVGALMDIRRHPDDFKAACEVLIEPITKVSLSTPRNPPLTLFFVPAHLNEMLSPRLYNEFYWPFLKKIIETLVSQGYKGFVFFEGDHTPHINTLLELPRGWGIAYFEKTEKQKTFIEVWEELKGHTTVMGGMPANLLLHGTPEKIENYIKELMSQLKKEGGFILAPGVSELPPGIPEANIKAYINSALKHGS